METVLELFGEGVGFIVVEGDLIDVFHHGEGVGFLIGIELEDILKLTDFGFGVASEHPDDGFGEHWTKLKLKYIHIYIIEFYHRNEGWMPFLDLLLS